MGNAELVKTLLGSGAVTIILVALMQAGLKLYENRKSLRAAKVLKDSDSADAKAIRDSDWNALFRHAAEKHLPWDLALQGRVAQLESLVNELRRKSGEEPIPFPPLPPAPPLFPEPRGD